MNSAEWKNIWSAVETYSLGLAALSAAIGFIAHFQSGRFEKIIDRQYESTIQNLKAGAVMTPLMDQKQIDALATNLRNTKGGPFTIGLCVAGDTASHRFADQLTSAIAASGWKLQQSTQVPVGNMDGLVIMSPTNNSPQVLALNAALTGLGYKVSYLPSLPGKQETTLTVGIISTHN